MKLVYKLWKIHGIFDFFFYFERDIFETESYDAMKLKLKT